MFCETTNIIRKYPGRIKKVESDESVEYLIKWVDDVSVEVLGETHHLCSFLEFELDTKKQVIKRLYCLIHGDGSENDPRNSACIEHEPRTTGLGCSALFNNKDLKISIKGVHYCLNPKITNFIQKFAEKKREDGD